MWMSVVCMPSSVPARGGCADAGSRRPPVCHPTGRWCGRPHHCGLGRVGDSRVPRSPPKEVVVKLRLPSPAMVVAVIALVVALSGTAIAAVNFAQNAGAVDGKSAVGAKASLHSAAGKLVATSTGGNGKGQIPARFLEGVVRGGTQTTRTSINFTASVNQGVNVARLLGRDIGSGERPAVFSAPKGQPVSILASADGLFEVIMEAKGRSVLVTGAARTDN